jgi:hypothetical protein
MSDIPISFPLDTYAGAGSMGHMVALFYFFENLLTVFHNGCINLHSPQHGASVVYSPHLP